MDSTHAPNATDALLRSALRSTLASLQGAHRAHPHEEKPPTQRDQGQQKDGPLPSPALNASDQQTILDTDRIGIVTDL